VRQQVPRLRSGRGPQLSLRWQTRTADGWRLRRIVGKTAFFTASRSPCVVLVCSRQTKLAKKTFVRVCVGRTKQTQAGQGRPRGGQTSLHFTPRFSHRRQKESHVELYPRSLGALSLLLRTWEPPSARASRFKHRPLTLSLRRSAAPSKPPVRSCLVS